MPDLKIYKEIGSVPEVFSSDAIYAIRTGPGFDFYLTDTTGSVAFKANSEKISSDSKNLLKNTPEGLLVTIEEAVDISSFTAAFDSAFD